MIADKSQTSSMSNVLTPFRTCSNAINTDFWSFGFNNKQELNSIRFFYIFLFCFSVVPGKTSEISLFFRSGARARTTFAKEKRKRKKNQNQKQKSNSLKWIFQLFFISLSKFTIGTMFFVFSFKIYVRGRFEVEFYF